MSAKPRKPTTSARSEPATAEPTPKREVPAVKRALFVDGVALIVAALAGPTWSHGSADVFGSGLAGAKLANHANADLSRSNRPVWSVRPPLFAQRRSNPSGTLAGEWRYGRWIVIIEQEGSTVRGSWKEPHRDKDIECSGAWFEGQIEDDRITGTRYMCGGPRKIQPLHMRIVDANTLRIEVQARGGPGT